MISLTAAPRIHRVLPSTWMVFYYFYVAGVEEKRMSEAAVPGRYPVENWVIHGIFALVWVGIVALPEPGSGKKNFRTKLPRTTLAKRRGRER